MGKPIMTREEFLVYEDHFNAKRYDDVVSYFNPNCTVEYMDQFKLGPQTPNILHGPAEFIESYKALHADCKEILELGIFLCDDKNMIVEFHTEFHYFRDAKIGDAVIKAGECFAINNFGVYDFDENGKFSRIRISHFRVLSADPNFKPHHSI